MQKIVPISGFPEWLPEQRMVEKRLIDGIARQFELCGFAPIETRAVELVDMLLAKGSSDKEIYALRRLYEENEEQASRLALHFDLTIPFARYVVERQHALQFPFKRYQIQKVWRGERPQDGRFREFYQADIDIVAKDKLPTCFDADIAETLLRCFTQADMPQVILHVNHRKILEGLCMALGCSQTKVVFAALDKLAKIGPSKVTHLLIDQAELSAVQAETLLQMLQQTTASMPAYLASHNLIYNAVLEQGLGELDTLIKSIQHLGYDNIKADFSIVRGLDYYTGNVFEGYLRDKPSLGAVCSGGRYDNLLGQLGNTAAMPGVGASIGLSRIMTYLVDHKHVETNIKTPTQVLIALSELSTRFAAQKLAHILRQRSIACEVFHAEIDFSKQIRYAEKKGIKFVLFPTNNDYNQPQIRNILTGEQTPIDIHTWH